tara:strand:+ start:92 stop:1216 length:1125 start_codon:yes stop_codon:yes gene_type:complete
MAYTTIDDPSAHFQTLVYTGNGSNPRNLTNDGNSDLKPDWIWGKNLTDAGSNHTVQISNLSFNAPTDSTQVATDNSSNANSPATTYGYCSASLTDGFTAAAGGTNGDNRNANGKEFACWQWKCNGGTVANNTAGNTTTSVQSNLTAGFTMGTYPGNSSNGNSIGHGLGAIPDFFMIKGYSGPGTKYWTVGCPNIRAMANGASKTLQLDGTGAVVNDTSIWGNVSLTDSIVTINSGQQVNHVNANYIFFAFKNIQGYSRVGQYVGNGTGANGPFVYTGFRPGWVMIKNLDATQVWILFDSARTPFNRDDAVDSIYPSETSAEYTGASYHGVDMMSNGFKVKLTDAAVNTSGADYLYMAFADHPLVTSTGIPTTAR